MDQELKGYVDGIQTAWHEMKQRIDSGDLTDSVGREAIDKVNDRIDAIDAARQTAALFKGKGGSLETKHFVDFARTGVRPEGSNLVGIDRAGNRLDGKALVIRDESLGGVLAPPEFVDQLVAGVVQWSPIRSIATVLQTSRTAIQVPARTGNFAAVWTSEVGPRTETTGRTYGLEEIPTHELYARVILSNWIIEDAVLDLDTLIQNDAVAQMGKAEGSAFVSGSGVGMPEGFLSNALVTSNAVHNGSSSLATADGIISLPFSIKEQYWPNGRYVLNRSTLQAIRLLKDGNGNYLWQPADDGTHGVSSGLPATLAGYPYTIALDMPSIAAASYPVAFGDFSRGYYIADRVDVQVLRDPYTAAASGEIILHLRKRVGGQVVLPEAINVLVMS